MKLEQSQGEAVGKARATSSRAAGVGGRGDGEDIEEGLGFILKANEKAFERF